jgi:hypothetical protein
MLYGEPVEETDKLDSLEFGAINSVPFGLGGFWVKSAGAQGSGAASRHKTWGIWPLLVPI